MDNKNKYVKKIKCELFNDNFQNYKKYHIPKKAQLVIADIPYNLGNNAFASSPEWYVDGDKAIDKRAERKRKSSSNDNILCIPANRHACEVRQKARI